MSFVHWKNIFTYDLICLYIIVNILNIFFLYIFILNNLQILFIIIILIKLLVSFYFKFKLVIKIVK